MSAPSRARRYAGRRKGSHDRIACLHPVMAGENGHPDMSGMPTVAEILALPEVTRGRPTIEAARTEIHRLVRWVHVSEVADIAHLLSGGELILSTGVALPEAADELSRYVSDLAALQVAGLVIELGRRFSELPRALVRSAEAHCLPLVALHTEVPFVAITEAAHSIIVNAQIRRLKHRDAVHRVFRTLAMEASTAQDITDQIAELAGLPVVFESTARRVQCFSRMGVSSTELLGNWDTRSRDAEWGSNTTVTGSEKWLTSPVTARGHMWGRVILLGRRSATTDYSIILEQGATTLALHMLIERDEHLLEQQTHRTLLSDIIHHRYTSSDDIHARAQALGLPVRRRWLMPMVVGSQVDPLLPDLDRHKRASEEVSAVSAATAETPGAGLVGLLDPGRIGVLFTAASPASASRLLDGAAKAIRDRVARLEPHRPIVIGVGTPVQSVDDLGRSFAEAHEAADVAFSLPSHRHYATVADIHLRGLVHLLREDPRVHSYRERELGPLLVYDSRRHTELFKTLLVYLEVGGNKSAAASRAHITRSTLYRHLSRIEEILGCNLEDPQVRYSLYVACIARRDP